MDNRSTIKPPVRTPAPTKTRLPSLADRIAAARDAARNKVGGDNSYYSAEARERLWIEQTILYLHGATRGQGKFGDRWELILSENDPSESTAIMSLAANTYRDELFAGLLDIISDEGGPIGPLKLTKFATKTGQSSWDFVEWTEDPS